MVNAARSDSQRSALHRASHRTASNALQRNEERKIILPRHHEDFRPNSQTLQPKQESNLTKSAEDFTPNRGAVGTDQLRTFDPKAKNGGATGLIQMDKESFDSIPNRKCTYTQYCKLPREKQLQYAEKYLQMRIDEKGLTGKHLTGGQLYTLIRRPASITKKSDVEKYQRLIDKIKKIPLRYQK